MLTLTPPPPFFPSFGWPLDDPISHENNGFYGDISLETSDSVLIPSPNSTNFQTFSSGANNPTATGSAKKLNHNANERDRRKKINNLYSSLFSLLPPADRLKKLSIPATVSCVVKYIPELQKEVERLVRKKEELSSKIQEKDAQIDYQTEKRRKLVGRKETSSSNYSTVNVSPVGGKEVVVQISAVKTDKGLLYEALSNLEQIDGLFLFNASSLDSFGDRLFHNLHFKAQENYELIKVESIRARILSLYDKNDR